MKFEAFETKRSVTRIAVLALVFATAATASAQAQDYTVLYTCTRGAE